MYTKLWTQDFNGMRLVKMRQTIYETRLTLDKQCHKKGIVFETFGFWSTPQFLQRYPCTQIAHILWLRSLLHNSMSGDRSQVHQAYKIHSTKETLTFSCFRIQICNFSMQMKKKVRILKNRKARYEKMENIYVHSQ